MQEHTPYADSAAASRPRASIPAGAQVHVWSGPLDSFAQGDAGGAIADRSCLSAEEIARIDLYATDLLRRRARGSRLALRRLLAVYLGMEPAALRFSVEANGKPALEGSALAFNVSHTDRLIAIAVAAPGRALGIDIEALDRPVPHADIARRFFHPSEWSQLRGQPAGMGSDRFFRLWTAKEAFIKATGEGMSRDLASFCVLLDPPRFADQTLSDWSLRPLTLCERHVGMVAIDHPTPVVTEMRLPLLG